MSKNIDSRRLAPSVQGQIANSRNEPRLSSHALFGGASKLWIEHEGRSYALSITRQGKLILTR